MKTILRHNVASALTVAIILVSAAAMAKAGAIRTLDEILDYKLFGISLKMTPDVAKSALQVQGFEMKGKEHPRQRHWRYEKGNIVIEFDLRRRDTTLRNIMATENVDGGRIELKPQVETIIASWSESADGKPVCENRVLRGKIALAECAVSDPEDRYASYYAIMSLVQVQQRLMRY